MDVEIVRDGAERATVFTVTGVAVGTQPTPDDAAGRGCGWSATFDVAVGDDWRSGLYLVTMAGPDGSVSHASFVVRSPRQRRSGAVLVVATSTWNAYNEWGGPNLYQGAHEVSFERPWVAGYLDRPDEPEGRHATLGPEPDPASTALLDYLERHGLSMRCVEAGWAGWERRFVRWAESRGWRIDIAQSTDLHDDPSALDGYAVVISVGHDEYWSAPMRDTVESFVAEGGNAVFLSGNTSFWQVRYEGPTMVAHKYLAPWEDPVVGTIEEHTMTGMWSDPVIGRPENQMTGVSFTRGGYARMGYAMPRGSGGYTVWRPKHWVFDGCDLRYGDLIGSTPVVVGYEADGCELRWVDGLPEPTSTDGTPPGMVVLATSPAHLWSSTPEGGVEVPAFQDHPPEVPADLEYVTFRLLGDMRPENTARLAAGNAVLGTFQRPGEGTVFTVGCTDWAHGLDPVPDDIISGITTNLLEHLGATRT